MKSLTFSCLIYALNRGVTKPIFGSKVAQKGKMCSKRQKLLKSCRAQSEKAYPGLINNYFSSPNELLTQRPWGREE